jgi:diguanylate cyclase (GGDEF)-like protein
MRLTSVLGLVVAVLLCGIAVSSTMEAVENQRAGQDSALQAAVTNETSVISGAERQTSAVLRVLLVNPAVEAVLARRRPPGAAWRADVQDIARGLAMIQSLSIVPVNAVCLDDARGAQVVCGDQRTPAFPTELGAALLASATGDPLGGASGIFLSPVDGRPSVAFLAPYRVAGRVLGFVHLDIDVSAVLSSRGVVAKVPNVVIQFGVTGAGRLVLLRALGPQLGTGPDGPSAGPRLPSPLGTHPVSLMITGHRAMASTVTLVVGGGRQGGAVVAIARAADPTFWNAWSAWTLLILAIGVATMLASSVTLIVSYRRVTRELSTDPLTGLLNRRALIDDLPTVCQQASDDRPAFLWFFDLNGFKAYNDQFGHPAGDTLLARLADRLREAIGRAGRAYRLGGDEFCVLVAGLPADPHALFNEARDALTEGGAAFTVTAAAGAVEIPRESREPTEALRLADQRMYQHKATSRGGAADLLTSVLHAALAQRSPDLGEHSSDVAEDVELLARMLGLDEATIDTIIKAGDLHDVGKLGIPDEIIDKPGSLTEEEWAFMKQHTVMGEQIIAAAGPSLEQIAPLVRASHERWDGRGYPDALEGEEIPLGARIIAICDSFHAMLDERPYKPAMSLADALAELRRCAGTQFDPRLVQIFCTIVANRTSGIPVQQALGI